MNIPSKEQLIRELIEYQNNGYFDYNTRTYRTFQQDNEIKQIKKGLKLNENLFYGMECKKGELINQDLIIQRVKDVNDYIIAYNQIKEKPTEKTQLQQAQEQYPELLGDNQAPPITIEQQAEQFFDNNGSPIAPPINQ